MGASSTRAKKTHYEVSHTVNGEVTTTHFSINKKDNSHKNSINSKDNSHKDSINRKDSTKKKNKNSVKITKKWSVKKSKSPPDHESTDINSTSADAPDKPGDNLIPDNQTSSLYRNKSSCLSSEDRDILLGKNRSRSGSDKSLRFSDFNKLIRKTRIDEWQMSQPDIPLASVEEARPDDICYICEVYTGSHVRACRVCCRAYHDSCLVKIGHPLEEKHRWLIANNKWSCHQCASLNHLLTQQEVTAILDQLKQLDISKDNITEAEYLKFCRYSLQVENKVFTSDTENAGTRRYRSEAGSAIGRITCNQFLDLESIRVLSRRCKDSLVHLLTRAELAEGRKLFQSLDSNNEGMIYKSAVQSLHLGMSRTVKYYPDDSIMYIDEDLDSLVTWTDFLRDTAIYFLGQRPNSEDTGSQCSINDNTEVGTLTFSSCGSLDVDDERYTTCDSEPTASTRNPELVGPSPSCLEDREKPATGRSAMLDEINLEIDRCHCLHQAEGDAGLGPGPNQTHEAWDERCTAFPQTAAGSHVSHPDCKPSPKTWKTENSECHSTVGYWADTGTKVSLGRTRSSHYNDNRQNPIPWEDVEARAGQRGNRGTIAIAASRRSEVILRQTGASSGQARAVSQSASRLAPAWVGQGEWNYDV